MGYTVSDNQGKGFASTTMHKDLLLLKKISGFLIILSSCSILLLFLYTTLNRLFYPYDLEWMEGGMLLHGLRVMEGQPLYVEPSSEFIPFIYPPLYSWLLGWSSFIFGLDYPVGRGISLIASLLATGALISIGRIEKLSWPICFSMGAFFLSTYENSGTFMDLVRTDSLVVALVGWSLVFLRQRILWASGILLCLAFLAKHNAAIFGIPMALWLWRTYNIRSALEFAVYSAFPALLMTFYIQHTSDGFFLQYLLEVPSVHPFVGSRFFWLAPYELISALSLLIFFIIFSTVVIHREDMFKHGSCLALMMIGFFFHDELIYFFQRNVLSSLPSRQSLEAAKSLSSIPMLCGGISWLWWNKSLFKKYMLWLWCFLVSVLFCCIMRAHHGGYMNVLMPGFWFLSLILGFILQRFYMHKMGDYFLPPVILLQLAIGGWDPSSYIPTEKDIQKGDNLIAELKQIESPILAPFSPWYAYKAGHSATFHLIALWDINHKEGVLQSYVKNIRKDILEMRWSAILVANEKFDFGRKKYYPTRKKLRASQIAPKPKIGWQAHSKILFFPVEKQ